MVDEWKEQLDAKTREFDILREQMEDPRNIDVLRQQFLMEYEQTFKDRLQTVLKAS